MPLGQVQEFGLLQTFCFVIEYGGLQDTHATAPSFLQAVPEAATPPGHVHAATLLHIALPPLPS